MYIEEGVAFLATPSFYVVSSFSVQNLRAHILLRNFVLKR